MFIFFNLLIFMASIFILYILQKKFVSFSKRVFISLAMAIVLGGIFQYIYGSNSEIVKTSMVYVNIVGEGYVRMLKMIVIPLIMVSIISSIVNLKDSKSLGKMGGLIISILVGTSIIAALVGIFIALGFGLTADGLQLGAKEIARTAYVESKVVSTSNIDEILKLGTFVIASYVALAIMFVIHLLLIGAMGLNPIKYLQKILPVLSFAFTSRTSAGTIPLNVETQVDKLGVSQGIANLSASFGSSIGQNGCAAIYPAMLAVMVAPTVGIPITPAFIIQLVLVIAISSFGVAGVGGGATFAALIVLSSMNLPVGIVGLLIAVEPLVDMGRTALNVNGSITTGVISAKILNQIDIKTFSSEPIPEEIV